MKVPRSRALVVCLTLAAPCAPAEAAAPSTSTVARHPGAPRVRFESFVGIRYDRLPKLRGWASAARVIEKTLGEWFPDLTRGQAIEDGSPDDLVTFLRRLPGPDAADISVVYLASQQAADGSWTFVNGQSVAWEEILKRAGPPPSHSRRVLIIDACHAATLEGVNGWRTAFPGPVLFAALPRELTFELRLDSRYPLDFKRRAPQAWAWSRGALPGWDHRLSFLGLAWMQASRARGDGPRSSEEWKGFFDDCCRQGAEYQQIVGRRWGSTLSCRPALAGQ